MLIPDLVFPVYKIDREQSKKTFEDTKEVFRSRGIWELSKGLNMFYEKGPLDCAS